MPLGKVLSPIGVGWEVWRGRKGGGGRWGPQVCVPKMARPNFFNGTFRFWSLWSWGGGGPLLLWCGDGAPQNHPQCCNSFLTVFRFCNRRLSFSDRFPNRGQLVLHEFAALQCSLPALQAQGCLAPVQMTPEAGATTLPPARLPARPHPPKQTARTSSGNGEYKLYVRSPASTCPTGIWL